MSLTKLQIALVVLAACAVAIGIAAVRDRLQPQILSRGCFHRVAHRGSGCAALIRRPDGSHAVELTNLVVADSPDLVLVLSTLADAFENESIKQAKRSNLGPVDPDAGYQVFPIATGTNVTDFHSVTIWNTKYEVNYTTAPLRRDDGN